MRFCFCSHSKYESKIRWCVFMKAKSAVNSLNALQILSWFRKEFFFFRPNMFCVNLKIAHTWNIFQLRYLPSSMNDHHTTFSAHFFCSFNTHLKIVTIARYNDNVSRYSRIFFGWIGRILINAFFAWAKGDFSSVNTSIIITMLLLGALLFLSCARTNRAKMSLRWLT